MGKAKMTVTIHDGLIRELDRIATDESRSRSDLVEEAVRMWQKRRIGLELIEGYREMADEDKEAAESSLDAGLEALTA